MYSERDSINSKTVYMSLKSINLNVFIAHWALPSIIYLPHFGEGQWKELSPQQRNVPPLLWDDTRFIYIVIINPLSWESPRRHEGWTDNFPGALLLTAFRGRPRTVTSRPFLALSPMFLFFVYNALLGGFWECHIRQRPFAKGLTVFLMFFTPWANLSSPS